MGVFNNKIIKFWIIIFFVLFFPIFADEQKERDVFGILIKITDSNSNVLRKNEIFIKLKSQYRLKEKTYFSIAEVLVLDSPSEVGRTELLDACTAIKKMKFVSVCELNLRLKPQASRETVACGMNLPQSIFPSTTLNYHQFSNVLKKQCLFPPLIEGEPWDTFWAQHITGADLLREDLKNSGVLKDENPASIIGIWDTHNKKHGEYGSHIIAGPYPSAIIPLDDPIPYHDLGSIDQYIKSYEALYEECRQKQNCPSYINNSMSWNNSNIIANLTFQMSSQGVTIITSADNYGLPVSPAKTQAALEKNVIVVASLTSAGSPSIFTNYGNAVTVSAPSDDSLRSYDYQGKKKDYSGTSGAAFLTTGILGGFTLLSRHHLSTDQATLLLEKTAIPLPNLPDEHLMGAGMVNAYKIGMVAFRIKEKCRESQTETQKKRCLSALLESKETYQFHETSDQLFEEAMQFFPECLSVKNTQSIDDCKKLEAFNNLRRAFLLNPTDLKTLNAVICVKEKHFGGKGTAFYQFLERHLQKNDDEIMRDICQSSRDAPLMKYFTTFSLVNTIGNNKCSMEALDIAVSSLRSSQNHLPANDQIKTLAQAILTNNVNREILVEIINSIQYIPDQRLVETILDHPDMTGDLLENLADTLITMHTKLNVQEYFMKIINHRKLTIHVLETVSSILARNIDKFSNPQRFIENMLRYSINQYSADNLLDAVKNNADKFPNSQELIERIQREVQ